MSSFSCEYYRPLKMTMVSGNSDLYDFWLCTFRKNERKRGGRCCTSDHVTVEKGQGEEFCILFLTLSKSFTTEQTPDGFRDNYQTRNGLNFGNSFWRRIKPIVNLRWVLLGPWLSDSRCHLGRRTPGSMSLSLHYLVARNFFAVPILRPPLFL